VLLLPFAATGKAAEEGAVARQIAREAAARLALGEGLEVQLAIPTSAEGEPSRYAALTREPGEEALAEAAKSLGADAVLAGAMRLDPGALWWRARLTRADGAPVALWEETTPLPQAPLVAVALAARALRELGTQVLPEAQAAFAEGVRPDPTRPDAWRVYCAAADALAAEDSGVALADADGPLHALLEAMRLDPGFLAPRDALLAFARMAVDGPHMPAAFSAVRALCALRPEDTFALAVLGAYHLRHGQESEARNALAGAEAADPQGPELITLGEVADALGDAAAAERLLRRGADLRREDPEAQRALGRFLARKGDYAGALAPLACAVALDDGFNSHLDYGVALQLKGDAAGARVHFERALELAGDDAEAQAEVRALLDAGAPV
jgi:predicted Zn-dependent protease